MSNIIVHTNPSLYDQSETLTDQFELHSRRNKNLFLVEEGLEHELNEFLEKMERVDFTYKIYKSSDFEAMITLLTKQTIGTQLYILATWDNARNMFDAAIEAGFTEDEIQTKVIGEKKRYVYCMKCFELNDAHPSDKEIQCSTCSAMLEVGPFYSKVRKGNIGYPFKPVTN